ncbi:unnamed protein product, partial [Acanthoscelides obtectus]
RRIPIEWFYAKIVFRYFAFTRFAPPSQYSLRRHAVCLVTPSPNHVDPDVLSIPLPSRTLSISSTHSVVIVSSSGVFCVDFANSCFFILTYHFQEFIISVVCNCIIHFSIS